MKKKGFEHRSLRRTRASEQHMTAAPALVRYRYQAYPTAPWRTFHLTPLNPQNIVKGLRSDHADLKRFPVIRFEEGDCVLLLQPDTPSSRLWTPTEKVVHLWLDSGPAPFFVQEALRDSDAKVATVTDGLPPSP